MQRILFVCHGNICRSPMAEFIMKDIVRKHGFDDVIIESCATSTEEIGNDIYPPAKRELEHHGISYKSRSARQMTSSDYGDYDYIVAMDRNNLRNMKRFVGNDPENKVSLMMDFAGEHRDVADPWYSGDFEKTFNEISEACEAFFRDILSKKK